MYGSGDANGDVLPELRNWKVWERPLRKLEKFEFVPPDFRKPLKVGRRPPSPGVRGVEMREFGLVELRVSPPRAPGKELLFGDNWVKCWEF